MGWDGRDMLVGVRSTEPGWTDNVYRYDGLASRVSTLESSGLTYYDWDSINVIQEKDADGDVTDRQVHGYAPIFSVGDIALMDKSGTPYVPVPDQVGTTWNLLNSAASKANSYTYDAFGVARSTSETVSNLYRFGTKRLDADPALYHFVARQYKSPQGILITRDRGVLGDVGPDYVYARGRATVVVDPEGLQADGPSVDTECCEHAMSIMVSLRPFRENNRRVIGRSNFAATMYGMIKCCTKVGIVQVHKWDQIISWWPDKHVEWEVDTCIPYSGTEGGGQVSWNDNPGLDLQNGSGLRTSYYRHEFESCAVCFDEGERCGTILGCIQWGHEWRRLGAGAFYVKRWITNGNTTVEQSGSRGEVTLPDAKSQEVLPESKRSRVEAMQQGRPMHFKPSTLLQIEMYCDGLVLQRRDPLV